ncbi:MAG: L-threonylcarbamoyladenylate synthase [Oscillospiraceae bacterium]
MKTRVFHRENIPEAAEILEGGGIVSVPTETVYGLCCNGLDAKAVQEIYALKGRPEVKPLSLMVHSPEVIDRYCRDVPQAAYGLAKKFLPGPLTIVLRSRELVPEIVRAGGETVGIRCPDHPLTLELLKRLDKPLAGPSANPSGAKSPKTADDVLAYFDGKIAGVLDGGKCGIGVESTIIDMSKAPYRLLRRGALDEDKIFSAIETEMTILGITGGTGGGKTTALHVIESLGGLVIDCDEVYHDLLLSDSDMLAELSARFPGVWGGNGVDRKKLGTIVFADQGALMDLNAITHKYVRRETDRRLREWAKSGGEIAAIDAIALIESGLAERCTAVIGIVAPEQERISRLMKREGISREYAKSRIAAQKQDEFFEKNCDYILENSGTLKEFEEKSCNLIKSIAGRF